MKTLGTFLYRVLVLLLLWGIGTNVATTTDLLMIQTKMMLQVAQPQERERPSSGVRPEERVADVR